MTKVNSSGVFCKAVWLQPVFLCLLKLYLICFVVSFVYYSSNRLLLNSFCYTEINFVMLLFWVYIYNFDLIYVIYPLKYMYVRFAIHVSCPASVSTISICT